MWSRIFRQISAAESLSIVDNARMFAMLYLTAADAAISVWDDKGFWLFWRPITAIREADTDGNPATTPDTEWLPLINTPPYPDHPSGHTGLSGSIVRTLQHFFGTNRMDFSATSAVSGTTRSFTRFSRRSTRSSTHGCGPGSTSGWPTKPGKDIGVRGRQLQATELLPTGRLTAMRRGGPTVRPGGLSPLLLVGRGESCRAGQSSRRPARALPRVISSA